MYLNVNIFVSLIRPRTDVGCLRQIVQNHAKCGPLNAGWGPKVRGVMCGVRAAIHKVRGVK